MHRIFFVEQIVDSNGECQVFLTLGMPLQPDSVDAIRGFDGVTVGNIFQFPDGFQRVASSHVVPDAPFNTCKQAVTHRCTDTGGIAGGIEGLTVVVTTSAAAEGQIEQKMLGAPVCAYLVAARADLSVPYKSWLRFDAVRHLY